MQAILLAGGGIDSTLCMQLAVSRGISFRCLHVDYGQPAALQEWGAVRNMSKKYFHSSVQVSLSGGRSFSPGLYLGRNAALVHLALLQLHPGESEIWTGIHAGTRFYDCSLRFFTLISQLVAEETDGAVRLVAPLLELTKQEIVEYAMAVNLPLQYTYSCQTGGELPCGRCLSCLDRGALGC